MATQKRPLSLRVDPDLLKRVDEARGDIPRTKFIERALEHELDPEPSALDDPLTRAQKASYREALKASPDGRVEVRVEAGSLKPAANLLEEAKEAAYDNTVDRMTKQRPFICPRCPDWPGAGTQNTRCPQCRSKLVPR